MSEPPIRRPPIDLRAGSAPADVATAEVAQFQVLQLLSERPTLSQRDLARELGLSLGKVNYCLRALIARGWVKANNFRRSDRKWAYAYVLTPTGLAGKVSIARRFLAIKEAEFDELSRTIRRLRAELGEDPSKPAEPMN